MPKRASRRNSNDRPNNADEAYFEEDRDLIEAIPNGILPSGVIPGGNCRTCGCTAATTCASAVWMLALGWKNTFRTDTPESEPNSISMKPRL